jgi:hypothetical protein
MDPHAIIDTYVGDVVRHLPRGDRRDVGFELRSLLAEDLDGRASDAGRPADEDLAIELLTEFGRPQEVADRYRPAGFTVIRPADAPQFARLALGGVALQWAITLPAALVRPAGEVWDPGADVWVRLSQWWLTWGLGAFWWPGIMITFTLVAAALGTRRGEANAWTPPRAMDRDRVRRPAMVLNMALGVVGATVLIALPWLDVWAPGLPQPLLDALAVDPEFLRRRAPWVLPLWAADLGLYLVVLLAGRWSRTTRRVGLALNVGWLALMAWWLLAGRIFDTEAADEVAKLGLMLVVVIALLDVVATLRRQSLSIRPPVE